MDVYRRQLQPVPSEPATGSQRPVWLSSERIRHRIIVRTVAGGATYVAGKIDSSHLPNVLGTVAGNDSVVVVCTSPEAAIETSARLPDILPPKGET